MIETMAITLREVSKKFRLFGSVGDRLREALNPFKKRYHKEFWALRDVSLDVPRGATVGIMGRNGSGKSTLLQIICGVMQPTTGSVRVQGRVSALLELGTGFNPESTGTQNVIANGMLMGFSRTEMLRRLPQINAFADIGEFVDQPVKTYSSGMYLRLAFAAAINVDPDILIVDEAIAVGDAKFQHKCYNKLAELQKAGTTIVLVTHNTDAILKHCGYAVLLESGRILQRGDPQDVTNSYLELLFSGGLQGYAATPVLVEEDHHGFNLVHYGKRYYALSRSLGGVDLTSTPHATLAQWQQQDLCLLGSSLTEVKRLLDEKFSPSTHAPAGRPATAPSETTDPELDRFLNHVPPSDNCVNRRGYNKSEYRYGDKRAEIIDYLIVAGGACDPPTIPSGVRIELYLKVRYHQNIRDPMTGFALKTLDGVPIFGTSTKNLRIQLAPIDASPTVAIFKWTVPLYLASGDYFLDVGCAEYLNGDSVPLDRRYSIAHITVSADELCAGFANLAPRFERIC